MLFGRHYNLEQISWRVQLPHECLRVIDFASDFESTSRITKWPKLLNVNGNVGSCIWLPVSAMDSRIPLCYWEIAFALADRPEFEERNSVNEIVLDDYTGLGKIMRTPDLWLQYSSLKKFCSWAEKTLIRKTNWQADRMTYWQSEIQTYWQTDWQMDRRKDRQSELPDYVFVI